MLHFVLFVVCLWLVIFLVCAFIAAINSGAKYGGKTKPSHDPKLAIRDLIESERERRGPHRLDRD